jgi:hypothetical protein
MSSFDTVNPLNQMNIIKLRDALNKKISQNRKKAPEYLTKQQLEPALKLMQELKFKYNYPFSQTGEKMYKDYKELLKQAKRATESLSDPDWGQGWSEPASGTFTQFKKYNTPSGPKPQQMRKLYATMHLGRRY